MKNKILIIITFLAGTLMFNSCLKDKLNTDWTSTLSGKMYAEIPNAGKQSTTITPDPTDQDIRFLVNIATDALPTSDITMTVAVDAAAMAAYNTANATTYVLYPTLTIVNPTVTIKAGTRNANVHITLKSANLLNLSTSWMVPITITAVSGGVTIADNKKTVLMALPIANKWEGKYKMVAGSTFSDLLNPAYFLNFPDNYALVTAGPYTVIVKDLGSTANAGGFSRVVFSAPGAGLYYGSWCAVWQIDPVTNKITVVTNYYGQPATNGRSGAIDATGVNTYTPATKTFDVSYNCLAPGTTVRLKFRDILTYTGPL